MISALQAPSLSRAYEPYFRVGAAVSSRLTADPELAEIICRHFSSITADNQMKPDSVLSLPETLARGDQRHAAVDFSRVDALLSFARDRGLSVRYHVLCWHNQTPVWFFKENWENDREAPFAPKEVLLARLENYILDVMHHVNESFPGVVYTWDVVNEAIEPDQGGPGLYRTRSPWFMAAGQDFLPAAFRAARKGAAPGQTLCYNDYNAFDPVKRDAIIEVLKALQAESLVDTMGMQGHYVLPELDIAACETAARAYAALGLKLQVTELDIHCNSDDPEHVRALAGAYRGWFSMMKRLKLEGADVEAVTFWGVTDADSWLPGFRREPSYPLLFTADRLAKPAFDAVLAVAKE
jgi:GH35 family endo-1,4-beta-xylanase